MLRTSFATKSSKNLLLSIDVAEVDEFEVGGANDCEDETVRRSLSKNLNRATGYLTPNVKQTVTQLGQAFTKALILQHFDLECHIQIEIDASSYAIAILLSQLSNLGR